MDMAAIINLEEINKAEFCYGTEQAIATFTKMQHSDSFLSNKIPQLWLPL